MYNVNSKVKWRAPHTKLHHCLEAAKRCGVGGVEEGVPVDGEGLAVAEMSYLRAQVQAVAEQGALVYHRIHQAEQGGGGDIQAG